MIHTIPTASYSWNKTIEQLQQRYHSQPIINRRIFEQHELIQFFQNYNYIALPTKITGLSKKQFVSYLIFTTEKKDRKVGTLIIEYNTTDTQQIFIEDLYFI